MNGVNEYFQSMDNIFLALNYAESLSRGDTARLAKSERAAQEPSTPNLPLCDIAATSSFLSPTLFPSSPFPPHLGGDPGVVVERWIGVRTPLDSLPTFPNYPDERFLLASNTFGTRKYIGDHYGLTTRSVPCLLVAEDPVKPFS